MTVLDDRGGRPAVRRLSLDELSELAGASDILSLGALADDARRARHGDRTTFVRVHDLDLAASSSWTAPPAAAREVRLRGRPESPDAALQAVRRARALAGGLVLRGFVLADLSLGAAAAPRGLYGALVEAGLDEIAFVCAGPGAAEAVAAARAGGLVVRVVGVQTAAADRVQWLRDVRTLQEAVGGLDAVAPLPFVADASAPTTGFDDVRTVAIARLAFETIPSIQVDWMRYGPKMAQVALAVGADDLDAVSALDDQSLGSRRAPLEEVLRNISAAGFTPAERDGRHQTVAR